MSNICLKDRKLVAKIAKERLYDFHSLLEKNKTFYKPRVMELADDILQKIRIEGK